MEVSKQISSCVLVWVNKSGVVPMCVCKLNEKVSPFCCPACVVVVVAAKTLRRQLLFLFLLRKQQCKLLNNVK